MEEDRFHRAARDGYLDLLHEASKRDCNSQDEDGMTPTLWAAHEGHLDALRLIVGRGGDPDKCDNYGNTALHCAAAKGHLNCVSFLVNFGANLWALDNDFHTCKDLAAIRGRDEILRFLDTVIAKQEALNKKVVLSLKMKAEKEAEKRVKEYDKLQKKIDKKAAKEEQRLQRQQSESAGAGENGDSSAATSAPPPKGPKKLMATISRGTAGLLGKKLQTQSMQPVSQAPNFSSHTTANRNKNLPGGVNRRLQQRNNKFEDRNSTVSGVTYANKYDTKDGAGSDEPSRRGKLADVEFGRKTTGGDLFDRPGFGSVAFRGMMPNLNQLGDDSARPGQEDSIGSAGSLNGKENPFDEQDLPSDDEAQEPDPETSALHLFLTSAGIPEFIPTFVREQIDLTALELLTEEDLIELEVPLGPRKKLQKALRERKQSLEQPGEMVDTQL
ncbi:Usher syndrome type-1G protein homolog [Amphibalanus amphitrite]|uniref:Usher syndrome type-1G protein homolog n=1 Tax=Amphibalanus amphitrite TaxID=1232801 RepID=UPI001C91C7A5|nr:Usher syndrome type-1G protein homolog [Amphibalanus amphitrite]